MERTNLVTFKGAPVTLVGKEAKLNEKAPNFAALDRQMDEVTLNDFEGKVKLISVVTSLDTQVCNNQARRLNTESASLAGNIAVMNISMDLPFAVDRFSKDSGIDKVIMLSDYRDASFGLNYGVLVKELRLLARAAFVIDSDNILRYFEIVPEITKNIDFEKALQAANKALGLKGKAA